MVDDLPLPVRPSFARFLEEEVVDYTLVPLLSVGTDSTCSPQQVGWISALRPILDRNVGSGFRRLVTFENLAMLAHQSIFPFCVNGLAKGPFSLLAFELELGVVFFGTESADPAYLELVVLFEVCALLIGSDVLQAAFVQLFCILI